MKMTSKGQVTIPSDLRGKIWPFASCRGRIYYKQRRSVD